MADPLLERYGGARGVSRLAFRFYDLVLASDRLRPYFEGVDMPRLVEHQAAFIVSLIASRPTHSDAQLAAIHAHLDIGEAEFDEMIELLITAMAEEGHAGSEAEPVLSRFRRMRGRLVRGTRRGRPVEA